MKLRTEGVAPAETAFAARRSSRRRKREPEEEAGGLDTPSSDPRLVKQQAKGGTDRADKRQKQAIRPSKSRAVESGDEDSVDEAAATVGEETDNIEIQKSSCAAKGAPLNTNGTRNPASKRKAIKATNTNLGLKEAGTGTKPSTKTDKDPPRQRGRKKIESLSHSEEKQSLDTGLADEAAVIPLKTTPNKLKRRRKTAEEKVNEAMPLAIRTSNLRMYVGAHVSMAKGVQNSVTNSHHIGGNAFALFLKSQRKWDNPPLSDENRDAFQALCHTHKYDASSHVLPHGSYLVNLAIDDSDRAKQAYEAFVDDLRRCEALGIRLYNFHPGAASQSPLPEAIQRLSTKLNTALAATKTVIPVLENMAGSGTVIGSQFSELRDVIAQIKPEFQSRIGVCIDTCHAYAAGYDLSSPETYQSVLQEFDDVVGLKYLKALHLNDSKAPLGSKKDLHQNIGLGFLGLRAFHNVMNDKRLEGLPLILETPCEKVDLDDPSGKKMVEDKSVWAGEIKMLESLIGMNAESKEFRKLEAKLAETGRSEREKMLKSINERDKKRSLKEQKSKGKQAGQQTLFETMKGTGSKGNKKRGKGTVKEALENESSEPDSEDEAN